MHSIRTISDEEIMALKGATAASYRLGGGVSALEYSTRLKVPRLSKCASTQEEHFEDLLPIDVAVEADRAAGSPVILKAMAAALGFELVAMDRTKAEPLTEMDAHRLLMEAMAAAQAIIDARADGKIDALETREIGQKLMRVVREGETQAGRL